RASSARIPRSRSGSGGSAGWPTERPAAPGGSHDERGPRRAAGGQAARARGAAMEQDKEERRGFQVKDRRRFSETGEARSGAREEAGEEPAPASRAASEPSSPPHPSAPEEPVTFSTFVLGLSTQALLHLGEIADPVSGAVERDLGAAKHVIDILAILGEKTRN